MEEEIFKIEEPSSMKCLGDFDTPFWCSEPWQFDDHIYLLGRTEEKRDAKDDMVAVSIQEFIVSWEYRDV
jgi:hypothetical protein